MDYSSNYYYDDSSFGMLEFFTSTVGLLLTLVIAVLAIAGWWKMFEKAGEPGWKILIPFYNLYMQFKICWGSGWYMLLGLVPFINYVLGVIHAYKTAKAFGKGIGFTIGLIFLYPIFILILGFGDSVYVGPYGNGGNNGYNSASNFTDNDQWK